MNLNKNEQTLCLKNALKESGLSMAELGLMLKSEKSGVTGVSQKLDEIGRKWRLKRSTMALEKRQDKERHLRLGLAAELRKIDARLSPFQRFMKETKANGSHLERLFKLDRKLTSCECLSIYSYSTRTTLKPISDFDAERLHLNQENDLVSAAKKFCKSIGLKA